MTNVDPAPRVAIIGGGLAGLAAAEAASRCGLRVELFEARSQLGGRAGSFRDPRTGQVLDVCQHVALGCCTALAQFRAHTNIDQAFHRHQRLHFFDAHGQCFDVVATPWLPAPLHLLPGLLRLGFLSLGQRWRIVRTMIRLMRQPAAPRPASDEPTAGQWLRAQGESDAAIERFWSVILASALGDGPDRVSLSAARQVFCEGFLGSRHGYELELPVAPLAELFDGRVADVLVGRGVTIRRGLRVRQVEGGSPAGVSVILADGTRQTFDDVIVAVPWRRVSELLATSLRSAVPGLDRLPSIRPAPITAVHLWFDRPIMDLPHAVLIGRLSQWVFRGSESGANLKLPPSTRNAHQASAVAHSALHAAHYYQVVISGEHALVHGDRVEIVGRVCAELRATWPAARDAQLIESRVLTQPAAVFCCAPGSERLRPAQATTNPHLLLAGDWTATSWPATMEGAVRSGYLAVEALCRAQARPVRLLPT